MQIKVEKFTNPKKIKKEKKIKKIKKEKKIKNETGPPPSVPFAVPLAYDPANRAGVMPGYAYQGYPNPGYGYPNPGCGYPAPYPQQRQPATPAPFMHPAMHAPFPPSGMHAPFPNPFAYNVASPPMHDVFTAINKHIGQVANQELYSAVANAAVPKIAPAASYFY